MNIIQPNPETRRQIWARSLLALGLLPAVGLLIGLIWAIELAWAMGVRS